jgi:uncharacterized protein YegP (UPF0339 family)
MENPKFAVFQGKDGQFYFKLIARNGEPILASEGYADKSGCLAGIKSVKNNAVRDEHFKRLIATNGEFYFTLIAGNNEVIGKSETYKTQQGGNNGIEAVKSVAPSAPIEDATDTPEIKVFEGVTPTPAFTPVIDKPATAQPASNEAVKKATPAPAEKPTIATPPPKEISQPARDRGIRALLWAVIFLLILILSLEIVQIIMHLFA